VVFAVPFVQKGMSPKVTGGLCAKHRWDWISCAKSGDWKNVG